MSEDASVVRLAAQPTQPKPAPEVEFGVSLDMPFSGGFEDVTAHGYTLVPNQEPTVLQLVEMRKRDGQARALYRMLTLPIRSALRSATFVPAEGGEAESEFIEQMLTLPPQAGGMTSTFHRFIAQLLMALFDGFSAFEQVYWSPDDGPLKGKWTLKKLAHRPSRTVWFITDEKGSFKGVRQRTAIHGKAIDVFIEKDNVLYYAANEEENPFYGVSYFNAAFYHYDKKVKVYYLAHLAAQQAATGSRTGTYPLSATPKERSEFFTAINKFGVAHAMTMKEGFTVAQLDSRSTFPFIDYVNHHNTQMSKTVLAQFIDEEGKSTLVDFSAPNDGPFLMMMYAVMDEIAEVINHYLIPKFIDWNFGSGKYPQFRPGPFTDEQKAQVRDLFSKLAIASKLNVTNEFVRALEKQVAEELGLEIDYDEVEAAEQEKQDVQDELELEQAKATLEGVKDPTKIAERAEAATPASAKAAAANGTNGTKPPGAPKATGAQPPKPKPPVQATEQYSSEEQLVLPLSTPVLTLEDVAKRVFENMAAMEEQEQSAGAEGF